MDRCGRVGWMEGDGRCGRAGGWLEGQQAANWLSLVICCARWPAAKPKQLLVMWHMDQYVLRSLPSQLPICIPARPAGLRPLRRRRCGRRSQTCRCELQQHCGGRHCRAAAQAGGTGCWLGSCLLPPNHPLLQHVLFPHFALACSLLLTLLPAPLPLPSSPFRSVSRRARPMLSTMAAMMPRLRARARRRRRPAARRWRRHWRSWRAACRWALCALLGAFLGSTA